MLNVFPAFAGANPSYGPESNWEASGYSLKRQSLLSQVSDFTYLLRVELRRWVLGSLMIAAHKPSLCNAVLRIVFSASSKQVRGTKAGRLVAFMKRLDSFWERFPGAYFERQPMHGQSFLIVPENPISLADLVGFTYLGARPLQAWEGTPGQSRIIINFGKHLLEQINTANLRRHLRVLHDSCCTALAMFAHRGATSILAHQGVE